MSRPILAVLIVGAASLLAFWLLLQTPGSLNEALAHPFEALAGTGQALNTTLLDASESAESVRAAGRRLLQPLGIVRLVRIYEAPDSDSPNKKR
jgi:hypothetical protein